MLARKGYIVCEGGRPPPHDGDASVTMRLAAVVGQDGQTVVGLAQGPKVIIWESSGEGSKTVEDPGFTATSGRRMITLKMLLGEGVDAVCTPPQGFCPHSYQHALRKNVRFIPVEAGATVGALQAQGEGLAAQAATELAPELLAEPHHHGHGHHHDHPEAGIDEA